MKRNPELERRVEAAIEQELGRDGADIAIAATEGVVTLAGFVKRPADSRAAEAAVTRTLGVRAVVNDVEVRSPILDDRADPDIARDAAQELDRIAPVIGNQVIAVVEYGDLRLEGRVAKAADREAAEQAVRRVQGVVTVANNIIVDRSLVGRRVPTAAEENRPSDPPPPSRVVLETASVREAVGIVGAEASLDRLVDALMLCGVDRADMSLMASFPAVIEKLHRAYRDPGQVADDPEAPRTAIVTRDEVTAASALVFGTLVAIGTLGAAVPILASGGAVATAVAAAMGGGAAAGALAKLINRAVVRSHDAELLQEELKAGGLVVFVRLNDPAKEAVVLQAMRGAGARRVYVHEVELLKTLKDVAFDEVAPLFEGVKLAAAERA